MSEVLSDFPSSPPRVGNFVIAYQCEFDSDKLESVETKGLLQFIESSSANFEILCETDRSFFPRAFTDANLVDVIDRNEEIENKDQVPCKTVVHTTSAFEAEVKRDDNLIDSSQVAKMDKQGSGRFSKSFQPDVIVSNSNQRSGPDGSPALVPSQSQGFIPSSNLSETGELFAPVRTLTFSDIDQSSQIEDSYSQSSRLVSTPNRGDQAGKSYDRGDGADEVYDYSNLVNNAKLNSVNNYGEPQVERSDSDENRDSREVSPEFRQLDGEADSDLTSTGAFNPSAMGINQDFLDHFTGRTGGMNISGDVFSPLGAGGYRTDGQQRQGRTPPLHSPGPNSPYANRFGHKSPRAQHTGNTNSDFTGETQFDMSPTRNPPMHFFNSSSDRNMSIPRDMFQNNIASQSRQDFMNNDRYFPNEHTFEPIEKQPRENAAQKQIPQNLNEYQDQGYNSQNYESDGRSFEHNNRRLSENTSGVPYRQGDGFSNEASEQPEMQRPDSEFDHQFATVSPSAFEQRYLQRTQVSVKLPQATYDTMTSEFSQDDRFVGEYSQQGEPTGLQPDSLEEEEEEDDDNRRDQIENQPVKSSPIKVVDLLQTQVSNLKHRGRPNETGYSFSGSGDEHGITGNDQGMDSDNDRLYLRQSQDSSIKSRDSVQMMGRNNSVNVSRQSGSEDNRNLSISSSVSQGQHMVANQNKAQFSQSMGDVKSVSRNPSATAAGVTQSQSFQTASQTQLAPSRLLQETVSQKNKTSQKFISSGPGASKTMSNQSKELKKPQDVAQKNSNATACNGARKLLLNEADKGVKPRFSDKSKSKSVSTESLGQKPKNNYSNQSKSSNANRSDLPSASQSKNTSQSVNQSSANTGQTQRGEGQGRVKGEGHNGSTHSLENGREDRRLITQVETTSPVPVEHAEQNVRFDKNDTGGDSSLDVQGMEVVRQQLQGMLRLSHDQMSPHERSQYEHSDILAGFGMDSGDHHHRQTVQDVSWNMTRKPQEEDLIENFPSFSSQFLVDSGNVSRSDVSLKAENQRLRDMLEKERYRRKHCEQYIQQLNVKLLETQQQVAVAVSTDKRKDIMIEQLDKQLARVVEGWKKRDLDKDALVNEVKMEKEEIVNNLKQQQEMIGQFERDMSQAVEALRQEKENSAQSLEELTRKVHEAERSRVHAEELVSAEQEKVQLHQQECDNLREARENLDKKLDQMQRRLHREQDDWFQREQELLQRIEEVSEKNTKILQIERTKNEEQGKLAEEIMEQYQMANIKVKKLEMDLDAALREKESVKVEIGIMEAKFENAQRILEADMHSHMEKQIAEQIADVQKRSEKIEDEVREKHHKQMVEMNQRHGKETEKQLAVFREEVHRKENEFRKQFQELEARLVEYRTENSELKLTKQKLESTRLEILTKLQYAMQSQWNEALSLLSATPQRKNPNQTTTSLDDSLANHSIQSVHTVNFNLLSPSKNAANHGSPQRQSTNQARLNEQAANQDSPHRATLTNHDRVAIYSPGQDSVISHSTEKDRGEMENEDLVVENTALSHLKEFQHYMNSLAQTPEWISSINTQTDSANILRQPSPMLPSPPDLAALLSTHLQNIQNIQHQQHMPRPHIPSHQSDVSRSQPNSVLPNRRASADTNNSASLPVDLNFHSNKRTNQNELKHKGQHLTPPRSTIKSANQTEETLPHAEISHTEGRALYGDSGSSLLWEGAPGFSRAVPIRPPQQSDDPYAHDDDDHSIISSIAGGQLGYFQGGQSFSPPTKQHRANHSASMEDLTNQSLRLDEDYSHLSDRLEKHESHQNELQHYIQMLLHKSPNDTAENNESIYSQDNEELDLNDTAQAAQLQKELDRIQELRQKQEASTKIRVKAGTTETQGSSASGNASLDEGQNKILNPDQLAEITKMLNQVKGQSQPNNPQVAELLELLKHAQGSKSLLDQKRGHRPSLRFPTAGAAHGDKHKGLAGVKRNVQFHPGKGVEGPKHNPEANKHDKATPKSASQPKKMERKVAGSATKVEKGPKTSVWK